MKDHNNDTPGDSSGKNPVPEQLKKHCFKKGNTLGGRTLGAKSRKTLRQEILDTKGAFTPAEFLLSVMMDEKANLNQRMRAAEKLVEFTEHKLSSISTSIEADVNIIGAPVINIGKQYPEGSPKDPKE